MLGLDEMMGGEAALPARAPGSNPRELPSGSRATALEPSGSKARDRVLALAGFGVMGRGEGRGVGTCVGSRELTCI